MIVQIQQTAVLVLLVCAILRWLDSRDPEKIPFFYLGGVVITALASVAVLFVTSLIRIWSV